MPDMTHKLLQTIKQDTSADTIYQFLIDELQTQIKSHAMNALYWKNQLSYMEEHGIFDDTQQKKHEMKEYRSMIKGNKKSIKRFKKSIKCLQIASKQTNKGEFHHE